MKIYRYRLLATQKGYTKRLYISSRTAISLVSSSFESSPSQFSRYLWESSCVSLCALNLSIRNLFSSATYVYVTFYIGFLDKEPKGALFIYA